MKKIELIKLHAARIRKQPVLLTPMRLILISCLVLVASFTAFDHKADAGGSVGAHSENQQLQDFVTAKQGAIPIILTTPHGGNLAIPGVTDRTDKCKEDDNDKLICDRDTSTSEITAGLANELQSLLGGSPYLVIAKFHRKYIDANRDKNDPDAVDQPYLAPFDAAEPYYDYYHGKIGEYVDEVRQKWPRKAVLIDVHGCCAGSSSVYRGTRNGRTVQDLGNEALTGPNSIFGKLETFGYTVFPPTSAPLGNPPESPNGGHTVGWYGINRSNRIDAIQIEIGRNLRNDDVRDKFTKDLARAIAYFYEEFIGHYQHRNPDVAYNSANNQFLTVWEKPGLFGGIYGELRDAAGNIVREDFPILVNNLTTTSPSRLISHSEPAVTYKSPQNVFVVAAKKHDPWNPATSLWSPRARIVARKITAGATATGAVINASSWASEVSLAGRPDIAADAVADTTNSEGSVLVVWHQSESILGQRIEAGSGSLIESAITLANYFPGTAGHNPAVTHQPRGPEPYFLVVYVAKPEFSAPYIARKKVYLDGTVSSEQTLSESGNRPDSLDARLDAAISGVSGCAVWRDTSGDLIGQQLNAWGNEVESNFVIKSRPFQLGRYGATGDPAITAIAYTGSFVVTYYQKAAPIFIWSDTTYDLYGKRLDNISGRLTAGTEFTVFNDNGLNDRNPALAYGPAIFMVAWEHETSAGSNTFNIITQPFRVF